MKVKKQVKRAKNPWLIHLEKFYKANKTKMSYTEAMKAARKTYQPMKK